MLRRLLLVLTLALAIGASPSLEAQKTVAVKGYVKKDGTYVAPHTRSAPGTKAKEAARTPPVVPASSTTVARDADGRIARSEAARRAFMKQTGYPTGRPGYIIDHVIPLACGGADAPANMQWQTVADAKAKDRVERVGCQN